MDAARLANVCLERIDTYIESGAEALGEPELDGAKVGTFAEAGVQAADAGVGVTLANGSVFQITVIQTQAAP